MLGKVKSFDISNPCLSSRTSAPLVRPLLVGATVPVLQNQALKKKVKKAKEKK